MVLASGVALGVYIPALLVERRLRRAGVDATVAVLEALYHEDALAKLRRQRAAFRRDFELACMTHRLVPDPAAGLDAERVTRLLADWRRACCRRFIVWSGFWLPILERYGTEIGSDALQVDLCRIDAVVSTSFRRGSSLTRHGREVWFGNAATQRIEHVLPVTDAPPIQFADREPAYVVHGGGWGLGTYRAAVDTLAQRGQQVHVVAYDRDEEEAPRAEVTSWRIDSGFCAWTAGASGRHAFPSMREATGAGRILARDDYHPFHDVIRGCRAIVSKPGGGTLIDSYAAATPLVFLPPYGEAERHNGELWQRLGYGIAFTDWAATGYDPAVVQELHQNLLRRPPDAVDYPARYAAELAG